MLRLIVVYSQFLVCLLREGPKAFLEAALRGYSVLQLVLPSSCCTYSESMCRESSFSALCRVAAWCLKAVGFPCAAKLAHAATQNLRASVVFAACRFLTVRELQPAACVSLLGSVDLEVELYGHTAFHTVEPDLEALCDVTRCNFMAKSPLGQPVMGS